MIKQTTVPLRSAKPFRGLKNITGVTEKYKFQHTPLRRKYSKLDLCTRAWEDNKCRKEEMTQLKFIILKRRSNARKNRPRDEKT